MQDELALECHFVSETETEKGFGVRGRLPGQKSCFLASEIGQKIRDNSQIFRFVYFTTIRCWSQVGRISFQKQAASRESPGPPPAGPHLC